MRANWGGKRHGSGRKPKARSNVITHPSSPSARALPNASVVTPPTTDGPSLVEEFDAPNDLSPDERNVWMKQAPHAFKNGTLTRASAMAFDRYCRLVVLERNTAKGTGVGGGDHRGLIKIIDGLERNFQLSPTGKPMPLAEPSESAAPQVDENDAFFAR